MRAELRLAVDLAVEALVLFILAELLDSWGEAWLIALYYFEKCLWDELLLLWLTPGPIWVIAVDAPCRPITIFLFKGGRLSFFSSSAILSIKPLGGGTGTNLLKGFVPPVCLPAVNDYYWFKGWIFGGLKRLSLDMAPPYRFKLPAPLLSPI